MMDSEGIIQTSLFLHDLTLLQQDINLEAGDGKNILVRTTGRFYTPEIIARHLIDAVLCAGNFARHPTIRIIEPFCGDGRLVCHLLDAASEIPDLARREWHISLWEYDGDALSIARSLVLSHAEELGLQVKLSAIQGDTFALAQQHFGKFDICITNPPWEVLKPDRRELKHLNPTEAQTYINYLRRQDEMLAAAYPLSAPLRKFSGWGTNLARCGTEVAVRLTATGGVCGVVSPASLLADQMSEPLRQWIFGKQKVHDVAYYVAEARLFDGVDQPCITLVTSPTKNDGQAPKLTVYNRQCQPLSIPLADEDWERLGDNGYILPMQFGLSLIKLQTKWKDLPKFTDLEGEHETSLWAGRELDETGHQRYLGQEGQYFFVKGRMIKRFGMVETPTQYVLTNGPRVPVSANHYRLAWRDVSRPNQKRRVQATIIPPGHVTGNSLSVTYYRDGNIERLKALLAVMNSFVFEAQTRMYLATAHISLGAVRQVRVPALTDQTIVSRLSQLTDQCCRGDSAALIAIEVEVARLYGLIRDDFALLLESFEKLEDEERKALLEPSLWL